MNQINGMKNEKMRRGKALLFQGSRNFARILFSSKKMLTLGEIIRKNQYLKIATLEILIQISSIAAAILCRDLLFVLLGIVLLLSGFAFCINLEVLAAAGRLIELFAVCVSQESVYTGFAAGMVNRVNKKSLQLYRLVTTTDDGQEVSLYIRRTKNLGFRIGAVYFLSFRATENELTEGTLVGSVLVQSDMRSVETQEAQERKERILTLLHYNEGGKGK